MICWSSGTSSQRFDSRFRRIPFGRTLTEARPTGNLPFIALPSGQASAATPELPVEREQAYRQGRVGKPAHRERGGRAATWRTSSRKEPEEELFLEICRLCVVRRWPPGFRDRVGQRIVG